MIDNLKDVLDDIGMDNEWAHGFVQDLLIRREEGRLVRLRTSSSKKLVEITTSIAHRSEP